MIAAMINEHGSELDMALDFGISILGALTAGEIVFNLWIELMGYKLHTFQAVV